MFTSGFVRWHNKMQAGWMAWPNNLVWISVVIRNKCSNWLIWYFNIFIKFDSLIDLNMFTMGKKYFTPNYIHLGFATPALTSILILSFQDSGSKSFWQSISMLENIMFDWLKTMTGQCEEDSREHGGFCQDKHNSSTRSQKKLYSCHASQHSLVWRHREKVPSSKRQQGGLVVRWF